MIYQKFTKTLLVKKYEGYCQK